jgi:hypothetical protein
MVPGYAARTKAVEAVKALPTPMWIEKTSSCKRIEQRMRARPAHLFKTAVPTGWKASGAQQREDDRSQEQYADDRNEDDHFTD